MISRTSSKTEKNKVLENSQKSNVKNDISIKIHRSYRVIVALADSNLIGKKFEEGIRQLDIRENFYKEKEIDLQEAIRIIQFQKNEDATFNIVGGKSIDAAIQAELITEENVDFIDKIPFTLTLL